MSGELFGDVNLLQLGAFVAPILQFGSLVGLVNGIYTAWMALARPKIRLFIGDSINIVFPPHPQTAERFQVGCNFINSRGKVGALHHLEAIVVNPRKDRRRFEWNGFVEYAVGSRQVQRKADPYPLAVLPRSNTFHFIEFKLVKDEKIESWPQGNYEFRIIGWANKRRRRSRPNVASTFHIEITHADSLGMHGTGQDKDIPFRFPIVEWSLQDTPNEKHWWHWFVGNRRN
jgi:hypothetical protein